MGSSGFILKCTVISRDSVEGYVNENGVIVMYSEADIIVNVQSTILVKL